MNRNPVRDFNATYELRESLAAQAATATPATADVFDTAIASATERLAGLAAEEKVQAYLRKIGGTAVKAFMELDALESTGLVSQDIIVAKRTELEAISEGTGVTKAREFLNTEDIDLSSERQVRTASPNQVEFAVRLGLKNITEATPAGKARKEIDLEVRKRGREVLRSGKFGVDVEVIHPKLGRCTITKIHEESVRVTLTPKNGSRRRVVNAMSLEGYKLRGR